MVEPDLAGGSNDGFHGFGKLGDGTVPSCSDVDGVGRIVLLHEQKESAREIVDVKELAPGLSRAPNSDLPRLALIRLVKSSHHAGDHVGGLDRKSTRLNSSH